MRGGLVIVALGLGLTTPCQAYSPAVDYALNCQGCHRADGEGTPGTVPALKDSVARFLARPEGRDYLMRVPGVAQSTLDDPALAAVLTWMVRQFDASHVPQGFTPFSAEEVGKARRNPLAEVDAVRRRILSAIESEEGVRPR
jgi:hypothetical protein